MGRVALSLTCSAHDWCWCNAQHPDATTSCAHCHHPKQGSTQGRDRLWPIHFRIWCAFGVLWLLCEASQAPQPPGFHTTEREPKRAHFRVPAFKNTTNIQRKDNQRETKRVNMEVGKGKKLWVVRRKKGPQGVHGETGGSKNQQPHTNNTHNTHNTTTTTTTTTKMDWSKMDHLPSILANFWIGPNWLAKWAGQHWIDHPLPTPPPPPDRLKCGFTTTRELQTCALGSTERTPKEDERMKMVVARNFP